MRTAICQLNIIQGNKERNLLKCEKYIKDASDKCADVIIFPEMTLTGFSMEAAKISEYKYGFTTKNFSRFGKKYRINIIFGFARKYRGSYYNSLVVINKKGKVINMYDKIHPFSYYDEDLHYNSGSKVKKFTLDSTEATSFICYDLRFPEIFIEISNHVKIYFIIANWPEHRIEHWKLLLRARATDNLSYIIGVNRTGSDGRLRYPGESMIVNPFGEIIYKAPKFKEIMSIKEIDISDTVRIREIFGFLKDRKKFKTYTK